MKLLVARPARKATSVVMSAVLALSAALAPSVVHVPKVTSVVLALSAAPAPKATSVVMTVALAPSVALVAMSVHLIPSVAGFKSSPWSFLCKHRAPFGAQSSVSLLTFGACPVGQSTRQHRVHLKATVDAKIIAATTVVITAADVMLKAKAAVAVAVVAVVTVHASCGKGFFPCLRSRASSEAGPCGAKFGQQALKMPACPYSLPAYSPAKQSRYTTFRI